ncbi:DUF6273 domain-containing protein [Paenibacillus sp.]|uniref:glycan biosynthesis hexose transferase WsfD n=1 Tax=Paenibacillus sp. TaxID=58172 RepID=UPI002D549CB1|nr:DUF6273 domain-containing protein [Paenibacillus sp.]HZG84184.1 DUF6273 domain-containing protein [Paenibacillus sp.]
MQRKRFLLAFLVYAVVLSATLFLPPFVGLADNSDYARVAQPLGLVPNEHPRYFHAYREYAIAGASATDDWRTAVRRIVDPGVDNELGYVSSQFPVIQAAMLLNDAAKRLAGGDPTVFDIRFLGVLYVLLHAVGLALMTSYAGNFRTRLAYGLLALLMLCDTGYVLYFHSLYGEAVILASATLVFGCAAWMLHGAPNARLPIALYFAAWFLFTGAKVANAPVGLLGALFSASFLFVRKDVRSRLMIAAGSAALLAFSVWFLAKTPLWMQQVNHYQAIFYGVLKDSPNPAADAAELGLPPEYAALAGTHGYMPDAPYDIYGEAFSKAVYERATYGDIALFYLKHPERLIAKLRLSAENAVYLRPSYLGNYEPDEERERFQFAERLSLWERARKQAAGSAFGIVAAAFALYAAGLLYRAWGWLRAPSKDARTGVALLGFALLWGTAALQLAVPVLGNGEADLQKHMFLFSVCFDLLLVSGVAWCVGRVRVPRTTRARAAAGAAAAAALSAALALALAGGAGLPRAQPAGAPAALEPGVLVRFGAWRGEPLYWTVLRVDAEEGALLWAHGAVAAMPFDASDERLPGGGADDYGSNDWETSDVRRWLNGPFLAEAFSPEERRLIQPARLVNAVAAADKGRSQGGDQPLYWSSVPARAEQNYARAYFRETEDAVFLLDVRQLSRYAIERGLAPAKGGHGTGVGGAKPYWLRTPYASSASMVRIVSEDGFVYHRDASSGAVGVVPALYLAPGARVPTAAAP